MIPLCAIYTPILTMLIVFIHPAWVTCHCGITAFTYTSLKWSRSDFAFVLSGVTLLVLVVSLEKKGFWRQVIIVTLARECDPICVPPLNRSFRTRQQCDAEVVVVVVTALRAVTANEAHEYWPRAEVVLVLMLCMSVSDAPGFPYGVNDWNVYQITTEILETAMHSLCWWIAPICYSRKVKTSALPYLLRLFVPGLVHKALQATRSSTVSLCICHFP